MSDLKIKGRKLERTHRDAPRSAAIEERVTLLPPEAPTPRLERVPPPESKERRGYVAGQLELLHRPLLRTDAGKAAVAVKLERIGSSAYAFFRGTAELYYRDLAGTDRDRPVVLSIGDVHPDNFGVVVGPDERLSFGITDFDEAGYGPFSWDLKRGATGFELAALQNDLGPKARRAVRQAFTEGYLDAMEKLADDPTRRDRVLDRERAKGLIKTLLEDAGENRRRDFLEERVDLEAGRFLANEEIHPVSERREEFQAAIAKYAETLGAAAPKRADAYRVKDVAIKVNSGTGSLGLARYYVLLAGDAKSGKADRILELKAEQGSVVERHSGHPPSRLTPGRRVAEAQAKLSPEHDPFLGSITLEEGSFLVRERSPYKANLDVTELDAEALAEYARACGKALAQAHARSGPRRGSTARTILRSIDRPTFEREISDFAQGSAQAVLQDFAHFRASTRA